MRLRVKLMLIHGGIVLGGALIALVVLERVAGYALHSSAEQRLHQSAMLLAKQAESYISDELYRLESLASMPLVVQTAMADQNTNRVAVFKDYFSQLVARERCQSFYLLSRSGDCVACDDPKRMYNPYARTVVSRTPSALMAFSGRSSIGKTVFSKATARPVLPISSPVWHQGEVAAILRTSVDMGLLQEQLFDSVRIGDAGRVYLDLPELNKTLPEGYELQVPDMYPRWQPPPPQVRQALRELPGMTCCHYAGENGDYLLSSVRMSNPPWVVVVTQPMDEVLAPIQSFRTVALIVILLLLCILLGTTVLLVAPVVRGIEKCREFAMHIREGRLHERLEWKSQDEVGDLAAGLNAMAAGLGKSRSDLAAAEAKYRLLSEAELQMLRFQLNPHFLFNVLNSVNALVTDEPQKARAMICQLADFCRATLLVPDDGMSTVNGEVELLNQYVAIEHMRWADALKVDIVVEDGVGKMRIPVFTLQPLVENAIKYGQLSGADPLEIRVRVRTEGDAIGIEVANAGRWFDAADRPDSSAGVGLANLKSRLHNIYGDAARLETAESEGWVVVRIILNPKKALLS